MLHSVCARFADRNFQIFDVIISLEIIVADQGDSFDIHDKQKGLGPYSPEHTVDQLSEGGLGLYLMETLMDEVRVQISGHALHP